MTEPDFIVPMMLAKFGPHRDALRAGYTKHPKPKKVDAQAMSRWSYDVFVAALRRLTRLTDEEMKPWWQGPGKNTAHHSGLVVYAQKHLEILVPVKSGHGSSKS